MTSAAMFSNRHLFPAPPSTPTPLRLIPVLQIASLRPRPILPQRPHLPPRCSEGSGAG